MLLKLLRSRKGQGLVEYALLVAGVSLACILAVSILGEKTGDLLTAVAVVLPGADADDNGPMVVGHLIEDTNASGNISIDFSKTTGVGQSTARLDQNMGNGGGASGSLQTLIVDPDGT